jgi:glycosyltransferase involved in cell wall biosynthesis
VPYTVVNSQFPNVSVILPNYNHERFLEQRIQSILGQTFQDFELIVLDDASTDRSVGLIKDLLVNTNYQLVVNTKNSGSPCSQWLKGIKMSRGEFIWIAESDDDAEPEFLKTMVQNITPQGSLIYCRTTQIDQEGKKVSNDFWPDFIAPRRWHTSFTTTAAEELRNFMTRLNIIPNASCCLFRRSCVENHPSFGSWRYVGDWLFWSTLMARSPASMIHFIALPLALHRSHDQTTRYLSASARSETRRFREYSTAIGKILRLSKRSWADALRMSLDGAWDWTYIAFQLQRDVFHGLGRFSPPFVGWHYLGYYVYLFRQLEEPFKTRNALIKHKIKTSVFPLLGK